jgi:Acetyltransferase (GNAT) domain
MLSHSNSIDLKLAVNLTVAEQRDLHNLTDITLPRKAIAPFSQPKVARIKVEIKRTLPQWNVLIRDSQGQITVSIGILTRDVIVNDVPTLVGGIGRIMTQSHDQEKGYAIAALQYAVAFLNEAYNVAFVLMICPLDFVPFYQRIGWQEFQGKLLVKQCRTTVPFIVHRPMLLSTYQETPRDGVIDLCGLPW